VLKKCTTAVANHRAFDKRLSNFTDVFSSVNEKSQALIEGPRGQHEDMQAWLAEIDDVSSKKHQLTTLVNAATDACEVAGRTTAAKGKEAMDEQLAECQRALDGLFSRLQQSDRKARSQIAQWESLVEESASFQQWLQGAQDHFKGDIVLKSTLDEKKAQLQIYRNLLQDLKSKNPTLDDLLSKLQSFPISDTKARIDKSLAGAKANYEALRAKAQGFVEKYEEIVGDHFQYTKAVMEAAEWITASNNTVEMWSDPTLDRLALHANLERMKGLQMTLPDERKRIDDIAVLGRQVIPNTAPAGQENVKNQIESSAQDWNALAAALQSSINSLNDKINQWKDFEARKDGFVSWLKGLDAKLHSLDLRSTLDEKSAQHESLKDDHGQLKGRELELDDITEKLQQISQATRTSRGAQLNELTILYQQVNQKIKDEVQKWQDMVKEHTIYQSAMSNCQRWFGDKQTEMLKVRETKLDTPADIDNKIKAVSSLHVGKEEGFRLVQAAVEAAQATLVHTNVEGQEAIKSSMAAAQEAWNELIKQMTELKMATDDNVQKWLEFQGLVQGLQKSLNTINHQLEDLESDEPNKRNQIEKLKELSEKMSLEKHDVKQVEAKIATARTESIPNEVVKRANATCERFGKLHNSIDEKCAKAEREYKDIKAHKSAMESVGQYLQRCKDKLQTMRQRSPNDKNYVDAITQGLDHLLNKEAQGQILLEQLQQTGDVLKKSKVGNVSDVDAEVSKQTAAFNELFADVKSQREQMGHVMGIFRDFKEETERLTDWLKQADINLKAAKTSMLATLEEKEKAVQDVNELVKKLEKGEEDITRYYSLAAQMKGTCLQVNVETQHKEVAARYEAVCKFAADVSNRISNHYDQHYEFDVNLNAARDWMELAWGTVRACSATDGKGKDELHGNLDKVRNILIKKLTRMIPQIRDLITRQDEGQRYVNEAIDWGEKAVRNTRSDGRDKINQTVKELQADWEKLVRKMSNAKVNCNEFTLVCSNIGYPGVSGDGFAEVDRRPAIGLQASGLDHGQRKPLETGLTEQARHDHAQEHARHLHPILLPGAHCHSEADQQHSARHSGLRAHDTERGSHVVHRPRK